MPLLLDLIAGNGPPKLMKLDIEGFEHRVLERYVEDAPRDLRPEYVLIEDNPGRREFDAVALMVSKGYSKIEQQNVNILMRKETVST